MVTYLENKPFDSAIPLLKEGPLTLFSCVICTQIGLHLRAGQLCLSPGAGTQVTGTRGQEITGAQSQSPLQYPPPVTTHPYRILWPVFKLYVNEMIQSIPLCVWLSPFHPSTFTFMAIRYSSV